MGSTFRSAGRSPFSGSDVWSPVFEENTSSEIRIFFPSSLGAIPVYFSSVPGFRYAIVRCGLYSGKSLVYGSSSLRRACRARRSGDLMSALSTTPSPRSGNVVMPWIVTSTGTCPSSTVCTSSTSAVCRP